jgi:polysaccharide chain length determinant protein (PEP-CTERM system associated)
MPVPNTNLSITDYLEIALRRKWSIILPFFIVMPVAIALCFMLPKVYKATTTILVIPQKVPDAFVKSTVTMNPSDYLNVLSQQIMSRTRLEQVINELSLFPQTVQEVPVENLVEQMRNNIQVDIQTNRRTNGISSFTISYLGSDPQRVMEATNRIASLFIEENLKSRELQAKKTTQFLLQELKELNVVLAEQEQQVSTFKQTHLGSLPEQRDANLRMLDQLILQRQRVTDELNDAENRKLLLQQQLLQSGESFSLPYDEQRGNAISSSQARINETKRKLADLQNRYTAEHPDVIAAQSELERLIAQSNAPGTKDSGVNLDTNNPLGGELLAINLEIKTLKAEDTRLKQKIADYQSRVEMAPRLEQELASLTRNYETTKLAYDELTQKRMDAEQAEKLEINQQGEQFQILDPAKVPTKPFKPDLYRIFLMGIFISLGIGFGLVFLLEYLDHSFYNVTDLESYLELPVLVSIPLSGTHKR